MSWLTSTINTIGRGITALPKRPGLVPLSDQELYGSDTNGLTGQGPLQSLDPLPGPQDTTGAPGPSILPPRPAPMPTPAGPPPVARGPEAASSPDVPGQPAPPPQPSQGQPPPAPDAAANSAPDSPFTVTAKFERLQPAPISLKTTDAYNDPGKAQTQPDLNQQQPPQQQAPQQQAPQQASAPAPAPIQPQPPSPPQAQAPIQPQTSMPPMPGAPRPDAFLQAPSQLNLPPPPGQYQSGPQRLSFPMTGNPNDVNTGSQLPPVPGQSPLTGQMVNTASNLTPMPKPPGLLRSIAAGLAGASAGGQAFAPLIKYGPKGLQQIQQRQQEEANLKTQEGVQGVADREQGQYNTAENNKILREQQRQNAEETKRQHDLTNYTTQTDNIRTNLGHLLPDGVEPSAGYYKVPVQRPDGKTETWAVPSENQRKLEAAQAAHDSDVPVGDKITAALGMPKGQKVPMTALAAIHNSYVTYLKEQNPDLDIIKFENKETGDATITARDKRTGKEVFRDVLKGVAKDKPASDIGSLNALDREITRYSKPHEKYLADSDSQLGKIVEARGMLSDPNISKDALAIPKILTALVSGAGTGVRITQAELNQIGQARGIVGDVQAYYSKLTGKGTLTPEQHAQYIQILDDAKTRILEKRAIANKYLDIINHSKNRDEAIEADTAARAAIEQFETGKGAGPGGVPVVGGMYNGEKVLGVKKIK